MSLRASCLVVCMATGSALAAPRNYAVDEAKSSASAHVGKTGIASFAGHEHVVEAHRMRGEVAFDPQDFAHASVQLGIEAQSLTVRPEGEPEGDAAKVQEAMRGPDQLDVTKHAFIQFRSTNVIGRQTGPASYQLSVAGELMLHGTRRLVTLPIQLEVQSDALIASGTLTVKLTDFGIEPTSAAGGMVKVENDVPIQFKIVARRTAG
jgi:polyisoprenoid-binding protein YceI